MPWLIKGLLLAAKSRRGRELLFAGALGAIELARSERGRKLYAKVWSTVSDARPREFVRGAVRNATQWVRR